MAGPLKCRGPWISRESARAQERRIFCGAEAVCYLDGMQRDAILERLRSRQAELRALGVSHAALFGSRARGEQRVDSDIDILVEI
ncbi:MAG: nucleotidyltransferase family protein, partial [Roseiarcus sp.]